MPDEPVVTPAAVQAPATTATPAAAPPPAAAVSDDDQLPAVGQPGWLKQRIDRATEDGEKKAKRELKGEKKAARAAADEAIRAKASADSAVAAATRAVDAFLADVPEAERNQLKAAAGGDPAKVLDLFAAWKLAKVGQAPAVPVAAPPAAVVQVTPAAPVAPAAPAGVAPPATSAPVAAAPSPAANGTPEDHAANYRELKASNPYLAAQYLLNHEDDIYPVRTFDQVQRRT